MQALALEQETRLPRVPINAALRRLHGLQSELENQGRKEAGDLRVVLAWIKTMTPLR